MHTIEPHYLWLDHYQANKDSNSPFFGREYSEFYLTNTVYNYFVHPQWDSFGSETLYIKIIFCDYDEGVAIIELIGEWNDCINNDIMFLKRDVLDDYIVNSISKFILIGENVFNFHGSDDSYYEEWQDDIGSEGGWITLINFREHILQEMEDFGLFQHFTTSANLELWRKQKPQDFIRRVEMLMDKKLEY